MWLYIFVCKCIGQCLKENMSNPVSFSLEEVGIGPGLERWAKRTLLSIMFDVF